MAACINNHLSRYGGLAVGREEELTRKIERYVRNTPATA